MAKVRVRYKGLSDVRSISSSDLKAHGIELSSDLLFSRANQYSINVDANDELLAILRAEGTFTVSKIEDDKTIGEDIVTATIRDDTEVAAIALNEKNGETPTVKPNEKAKP